MAIIKKFNSVKESRFFGAPLEIPSIILDVNDMRVLGNTQNFVFKGKNYSVKYSYSNYGYGDTNYSKWNAYFNQNQSNAIILDSYQASNSYPVYRFPFSQKDTYLCCYLTRQSDGNGFFRFDMMDKNDTTTNFYSNALIGLYGYNEFRKPNTMFLSQFILNDKNYFGCVGRWFDSDKCYYTILVFDLEYLEEQFGSLQYYLYDDIYGNFSGAGGYSGYNGDNSSDTIGIPNAPTIGVTNTGFMNVYNPSINALIGLGSDLFPDFEEHEFRDTGDISDVVYNIAEVGSTIFDLLKSYINSRLIDYVVDCHIIPCVPQTEGSEQIKIGFKSFPQLANKVSSDYVLVDCGNLNIAEYYSNFIDYVGTQAKLYLPFIGYVGIEPELFQNGSLNVSYRFNIIDGSFMCYVKSTSSKSNLTDSVIAEYGGNCCIHIPLTGTNYSSLVSGVLTGSGATVSNLKNGNPLGAIDSALNTLASKPTLESSNNYNSSSSFLGIRTPYLIISRQVASFSEKYREENGLPLNTTKKLSEVQGLTVCENLILNFDCLKEEEEQIKNLFSEGVYL